MQTKIDCSKSENYIKEFDRLCKSQGICTRNCPMHYDSDGIVCPLNIPNNPQLAIEKVQQWSDEHPIKPVVTRQDKFLEVFNLSKEGLRNGTIDLRPCDILVKYEKCGDFKACYRCRENYWSQPYKEKDK